MSGTSTEIEIEDKKEESSGPDASRTRMGVIIGVASFIGIVAIVVIATVLTLKDEPVESLPIIKDSEKLDCLPQLKLFRYPNEESMCKEKSCIYDSKNAVQGAPRCYYNTDKLKYKLKDTKNTTLGKKYTIENIHSKYSIVLEFEFLHQDVLRFKLSKENEKAYEVPITIRSAENKAENVNYDIEVSSDADDFYFKIIRKSSKQVIWDTSLRGLMFDKNFIQIATHLPSQYVYGFGENSHESFKHDISYRSWPMFSRDQIASETKEANLYGVQPFYTCMENDGNSHGVLLVNSNAMEYEFIPAPGLIYRTTGGVLDFYAFLGPDPETVIQQYTYFIGRSFFPPYWALGFQVSRYGYLDLDDMKQVLVRFKNYSIPIDTQVADIDHMDERKIFTIDQEKWGGIDQYFNELNAQGMKTIILFDPFLIVNNTDYEPFKRGKEKKVFITWPDGVKNPDFEDTNSSIMVGYCWPKGKVAYPDFFKNVTREWWKDEILKHREKLIYNGLWIDMNEPAVFGTNEERPFNWPEDAKPYWSLKCPDNEYELVNTKASFLYKEKRDEKSKLSQKTLCMNAVQGENNEYKHFDVHSLYGFMQTIPTYEVSKLLDDKNKPKRGLVITRSNYIGTGQYAGHWTGDNDSKWSHLYYSIIGMLEFNLFGIPYVGADICGFWDHATEELCQRWQQVGAFYPFSRNHNGKDNIPQDPGAFGAAVALSSKKALDIRYTLLPYYYTLFYKAHTKGNTVIRPLFHEYPKDKETYTIDKQFLIGSSILITPVLLNGTTKVNGYFPNDHWYSYYDGKRLQEFSEKKTNGSWQNLNAPLDFIPIHISGGHIIPTQQPANNTVFSRQKPFGLIIAMDWDDEARGDLFYDDGESYDFLNGKYFYATFIVKSNSLKMNIEKNGYSGMNTLKLDTVRIFVANRPKLTFLLNGNTPLNANQVVLSDNEITLVNLNLRMDQEFEISWKTDTVIGSEKLI